MEYERLANIKISEHIGKRIYVQFMCKDVVTKAKKDGSGEYMSIAIQDRNVIETGVKLFQVTSYHREMIKPGWVYSAAIDVQEYDCAKNGYSLKIYNIELISVESADYLDWCSGRGEAADNIVKTIEGISDKVYGTITKVIMSENWNDFVIYPAANSMHHYQLGGLCVHTNEVLECSKKIAEVAIATMGVQDIDIELIEASAILHDIGKIKEFSLDRHTGITGYSSEAALQSHVTKAMEYIDEVVLRYSLGSLGNSLKEAEKIRLLKHCVLAHHGKREYGSPIEPSIIEAYIISKADGISADICRFNKAYDEMGDQESMTTWNSGKIEVYYKRMREE